MFNMVYELSGKGRQLCIGNVILRSDIPGNKNLLKSYMYPNQSMINFCFKKNTQIKIKVKKNQKLKIYSEPRHIYNLWHIQNPEIFKSSKVLASCQTYCTSFGYSPRL